MKIVKTFSGFGLKWIEHSAFTYYLVVHFLMKKLKKFLYLQGLMTSDLELKTFFPIKTGQVNVTTLHFILCNDIRLLFKLDGTKQSFSVLEAIANPSTGTPRFKGRKPLILNVIAKIATP